MTLERPMFPPAPFYGAQCPSYPNCVGGCGLGCTKEHVPIDKTRRKFLTQAVAAVAGGAAIGVALPLPGAAVDASTRLLTLEKQILEAHDAAHAYTDDITRCMTVWRDVLLQLEEDAEAGRSELSQDERWASMQATCASQIEEQGRLSDLQQPHYDRMDELIKEMWATPAKTADERRAKVEVLLACIMPRDWQDNDHDADYDIRMARQLLIEFVGGKPADILADQFSDAAVQL